tara:strand:+ start:441 stop:626 length:186 start_codon:yes stop_codon:yes gene_type:complete
VPPNIEAGVTVVVVKYKEPTGYAARPETAAATVLIVVDPKKDVLALPVIAPAMFIILLEEK